MAEALIASDRNPDELVNKDLSETGEEPPDKQVEVETIRSHCTPYTMVEHREPRCAGYLYNREWVTPRICLKGSTVASVETV